MAKPSILLVIAARKGSRGLRHKNVQKVGGVPLLVRAVDLALRSRRRRENWSVVVSTDSQHYLRLARKAGATVYGLRPARLATHRARLIDVVLHALQTHESKGFGVDRLVLLSATTPFTRPRDVRKALDLSLTEDCAVASVTADEVPQNWRFRLSEGRMVGLTRTPVGRRQVREDTYLINGAIYVATPAWLRRYQRFVVSNRTRAYSMPRARSLDIETAEDLAWANYKWRANWESGTLR